MTGSWTITAVIPTKNRPVDLVKAVASVLEQCRLPDELVVVDQSASTESKVGVEALLASRPNVLVRYCHDPSIGSLVEAKQAAVTIASSEIVCFLEDDIVLDAEYIAEIERVFVVRQHALGCSGIIRNAPRDSPFYVALHRIFFQGIFRDQRPRIQAGAGVAGIVPSNVLWGGQTAWKREVFARVPFDPRFHMMEDIEFSTRVVRKLGPHLWVNTKATLLHFSSEINRAQPGERQRRTLTEAVLFYRKRRHWSGARRGLALVIFWWGMSACWRSVMYLSAEPLTGFFQGIRGGWSLPVTPAEASRG